MTNYVHGLFTARGFPDKCILRYIPEAYGSFFDVDESRSSHSGGG